MYTTGSDHGHPISIPGGQGSNVIYLGKFHGKYMFAHMELDGPSGGPFSVNVETLDELRKSVSEYNEDPHHRDPNLSNYKFTQRFQPKVPPCLQ
jgi:hypothetical protein